MSQKPDDGTCVFGATAITRHVGALRQEIEGVRQAEDIEYIHRMRVASRRLRASLPLFSDCLPQKKYAAWEKQVRAITRALGKARDLDVQLDLLNTFSHELTDPSFQPGIRRLQLRLRQRRAKIQQQVNQALDDLQHSDTLPEIDKKLQSLCDQQGQVYLYTPGLYQRGYEAIAARLDDFLSYEPYVEQPERITELHQMRIAAKRLRYTLEVFAPLYPDELKQPIHALRRAQDLLGEIHDSDVWAAFLPEFISKERRRTVKYLGSERPMKRLIPGILHFQENRAQFRQDRYQAFVEFWHEEQQQNRWQEIYQSIQIPYHRGEAISTPNGEASSEK